MTIAEQIANLVAHMDDRFDAHAESDHTSFTDIRKEMSDARHENDLAHILVQRSLDSAHNMLAVHQATHSSNAKFWAALLVTGGFSAVGFLLQVVKFVREIMQ